jgi:hypothetical protein
MKRRVPLNGDVLCLNRTFLVSFLREKLPFKNRTPKSGAVFGATNGILLTNNDIILAGTTNTTYTIITNQEEEGLKGPDKE